MSLDKIRRLFRAKPNRGASVPHLCNVGVYGSLPFRQAHHYDFSADHCIMNYPEHILDSGRTASSHVVGSQEAGALSPVSETSIVASTGDSIKGLWSNDKNRESVCFETGFSSKLGSVPLAIPCKRIRLKDCTYQAGYPACVQSITNA